MGLLTRLRQAGSSSEPDPPVVPLPDARPGERLVAIRDGWDASLHDVPCRIVLTDQRLAWLLQARPDAPVSVEHADVMRFGYDDREGLLALESRHPPIVLADGTTLPPRPDEPRLVALRFDTGTAEGRELAEHDVAYLWGQVGRSCVETGARVVAKVRRYYRLA